MSLSRFGQGLVWFCYAIKSSALLHANRFFEEFGIACFYVGHYIRRRYGQGVWYASIS